MRLKILVVLLVIVAVISCGKDRITRPGVIGDEIVFHARSTPDTTYTHLFVVNADGSGFHKLADADLNDSDPRWSPDGTRIVFLRQYHKGFFPDSVNVTIMSADGSDIVRLTADDSDANPSWSGDGAQIAYQRGGFFPIEVWAMVADGSNPHLYMSADSTNGCWGITWTPQNTLLGGTFSGLWMQLTPTSTSLTRVAGTQVIAPDIARLSPDGSRIAFTYLGYTSTEPEHIVTVRTDGSDWKELTQGGQYSPVWSPDGNKIAFVSDRKIWIMNADGSNPRPIPMRQGVSVFRVGDWR